MQCANVNVKYLQHLIDDKNGPTLSFAFSVQSCLSSTMTRIFCRSLREGISDSETSNQHSQSMSNSCKTNCISVPNLNISFIRVFMLSS